MIPSRSPTLEGILRRSTAALLLAAALVLTGQHTSAQALLFALFERYLDSLRQQAGIPGLSAAIVQDGETVWETGLGYQDLESSVRATSTTPYPVGDLTQTFASVLLMQCVERGSLLLDERLAKWSADAGELKLWQALSHTGSTGSNPFKYDPATFAKLTPALDACGGQSARTRVARDVFAFLAMIDSVPGRDLQDEASDARPSFDSTELQRYSAVLSRLAVPYKVDKRGKATRSDYASKRIDASTGLISTAHDLAKYDAALDDPRHILLHDAGLTAMWSNVTPAGMPRPTGLGWFVQTYNGQRLIWHFANVPDAYSALILKVPARHLTLILLANSDGLSAPFDLAQGDVSSSLFAVTFLRLFL